MKGAATVFVKEVRESLRERRVLATCLLAGPLPGPLLLGALLALAIDQHVDDPSRPIDVPVIGGNDAPHLMDHLRQRMIDVHLDTVAAATRDSTRLALRETVARGEADVAIVIADDFAEALAQGRAARVWIVSDQSNQSARPAIGRVRGALAEWNETIGALRLQARGVDPFLWQPVAVLDDDVSTPSARGLHLLGVVSYFLLFATLVGGSQVATDSTAGERERRTLEPLLTMPVARATLVLGKALATMLFMSVSLAIAVLAFYIAIPLLPLERVDVTAHLDALAAVQLFAQVWPFSILGAGLMLAAASYSRTLREAHLYTNIAMQVPTLPIIVALVTGVQGALPLMLVPSLSQHLLVTGVLANIEADPVHVALSVAVTVALGVLLVHLTVHRFRSERLIV